MVSMGPPCTDSEHLVKVKSFEMQQKFSQVIIMWLCVQSFESLHGYK